MKEGFWIEKFGHYLRSVKNRSENTARAYVSDVTGFMEGIHHERWSEITEEDAAEYVTRLKQTARGTSIARKISVLKTFFTYLRRQRVIDANPFDAIEFQNYHRPVPNSLTTNEMNRLLGSVRESLAALMGLPTTQVYLTIRDKAMLEVLYSAGLRVSELVGLNWEDINWTARQVRVLGKGSKERLCPLGQYAMEALLALAERYQERFYRKAQGPSPVFVSQWNRRILTRSIPRVIKKWADKAGINKRINPHAFRHSAAQHMLDGGADLRVIQALLGHASINTTQIYTSVAMRKVKSVHANTHPRA